jgi:hypothetical protein
MEQKDNTVTIYSNAELTAESTTYPMNQIIQTLNELICKVYPGGGIPFIWDSFEGTVAQICQKIRNHIAHEREQANNPTEVVHIGSIVTRSDGTYCLYAKRILLRYP